MLSFQPLLKLAHILSPNQPQTDCLLSYTVAQTIQNAISPNDSLHIGDILKISILGTISFQIFDHTITLFTTNLLINAVIKDIQNTNENLKILYGDTDSKPMYVSYMAFITEEEAEKELKLISTHEDDYIYALTKNDYIRSYLK